jgi:hypothetical protein
MVDYLFHFAGQLTSVLLITLAIAYAAKAVIKNIYISAIIGFCGTLLLSTLLGGFRISLANFVGLAIVF